MKQLLLSKLPALFAALAAEQKLYIPADDAAGQANFTLWREGLQLTKKLNTVRSAKDLFFPQVENLVGFRVTGKQGIIFSAISIGVAAEILLYGVKHVIFR